MEETFFKHLTHLAKVKWCRKNGILIYVEFDSKLSNLSRAYFIK